MYAPGFLLIPTWVGICGVRGPGKETEHSLEEQSRVASVCPVTADGGEFLVTRGTRNLPSEDLVAHVRL